ncbi:hypothetical protein QJS66_02045 [Kocuria rhizophila]|nr:hypothetical protein QJS66_02045 [Kocuria rhizophila]
MLVACPCTAGGAAPTPAAGAPRRRGGEPRRNPARSRRRRGGGHPPRRCGAVNHGADPHTAQSDLLQDLLERRADVQVLTPPRWPSRRPCRCPGDARSRAPQDFRGAERPAVAARARHGRDVHGRAASHGLTGPLLSTALADRFPGDP